MQLVKVTAFLFLLGICCGYSFGQQAIKTKNGAEINGLKQYIEVQTKNSNKPILLFLHGGPGFSSRPYFNSIKKSLDDEFIVVQWDQRETGITKAWNQAPKPITLSQMHQDTEEVIDYLLRRFDREKLYLVGFSWGGYLGFTYARNHPEKLHAYVSVSGMISNWDSEEKTLDLIQSKAKEENLTQAIQELGGVQVPFENWEQLYFQRKWTAYFNGNTNVSKAYPKSLFESWAPVWFDVFQEASKENFIVSTPELECPIFFMIARKDLVANYQISQDYFEAIKAPKKELIWFQESTHEIPSDEPKRFVEEVLRIKEEIR